MIVPSVAAPDGSVLFGQTWDMHDSATEHAVLLSLPPDSDPAGLVFTTADTGDCEINFTDKFAEARS